SRRAGTTVIVENDQTVVLGGIISKDDTRKIQKLPILGDLPFIGNLFKNQTTSKNRTELVVFLTPHVVRDEQDPDTGLKDQDLIREYERHRLSVDPLKILEAPLAKPLDI